MCTVSWWSGPQALELFFNRDEQRTRSRADAPAVRKPGEPGLPFIAPRDPDGGGSWIAVNGRGICVCLLNGYNFDFRDMGNPISRGQLVWQAASLPGLGAIRAFVETAPLRRFRPFILLALQPARPGLLLTWTGRRLLRSGNPEQRRPLCTSSIRTGEAIAWRRRQFSRLALGNTRQEGLLRGYHLTQNSADSALGVCMDRADACTVSLTRVSVGREKVSMGYAERLGNGFGEEMIMELPAMEVRA